jgi:zinc protease
MGSHADIESARINDVRDYFKHYYTPNNASLAIVGDFKTADVKKLVEQYFGPLKRGPEVTKVQVTTPPITAERRLTVTDTVQLPKVTIAWLTPPDFTAGDAEGDLAAHILGQGKASLLYHALVYEQQIAQSATCSHQSLALGSPFICEIVARPGITAEKLEKAADEVLAKFRQDGPTEAQLQGAKNGIESSSIMQLQSYGDVANLLNEYNQYLGDPGYLAKDVARYEAATTQSVKGFVDNYLESKKSVVVYGIPGKKVVDDVPRSPQDTDANVKIEPEYDAAFYASQTWRKEAPKPGPEPKFNLPEPKVFSLSNGLQVYFVEQHYLPLFSASLVNRAGSVADPAKLPGVASFTSSMLTQGTTHRSATQIALDEEQYGAGVSKGAGTEEASVNVNSLVNNSGPALELMSDIALHPAFDSKEVERLRAQRLTALLQMKDEPIQVALSIAKRALYGRSNPLGHIGLGDEDSNKATQPGDLQTFFASHYVPGSSLLVLTGDLTEAEAHQMAEKYFGGWQATAAAPVEPAPPAEPRRKVILVDAGDAPQSAMIAVGKGTPRSNPDYPRIQVMNSMLGGLFSSRINMNLREEHGYTYGAFSFFQYQRTTGDLLAGAEVRTDITAEAVTQLYKELGRIRTEPLTPAELKLSIDSNVRSLPAAFATGGSIAETVAGLWIYNLPLDYYKSLPEKFEHVTPEQAAEAAKKYVDPDHMFLILVGDKKKFEAPVKALNLGPVEYWGTDGKPLSQSK